MARKTGRIRAALRAVGGVSALAVARSVALFVGVYSLANTAAGALSSRQTQDLWWIDLRFLPSAVAVGSSVACAVVMIAFAVAPKMSSWRRVLTLVACVALAAAALQNVTAFYRAWGAGSFAPAVPFPFSLVIAAVFGLLGWAVWMLHPKKLVIGDHIAVVVGVVVVALLFPLASIILLSLLNASTRKLIVRQSFILISASNITRISPFAFLKNCCIRWTLPSL